MGGTVRPFFRVVDLVMLRPETAGEANDRVKVEGNFLEMAFLRREAVRALRATRVAAIARVELRCMGWR